MEEKRDARGLTEAEAIARYRSKNYPKPALTGDIMVLARDGEKLNLLLVERGGHPFIGKLALPGGFANENEAVEDTAARELEEETGVKGLPMELVGVFSRPGRDPRGWVASVVFATVVDSTELSVQAGDDAASAFWYQVELTPDGLLLHRGDNTYTAADMAFDHAEIIEKVLKQLGLS